MLAAFLNDNRDFPGQNIAEFIVNAGLLLMVGWTVVGAAYAIRRFNMRQETAFAACVVVMALFAYLIASGTYRKMLQPLKPLDNTVDRISSIKPPLSVASSRPFASNSVAAALIFAAHDRVELMVATSSFGFQG